MTHQKHSSEITRKLTLRWSSVKCFNAHSTWKLFGLEKFPLKFPKVDNILYTTWIIVGLLLMADIHINIKHITCEFESGIGNSKQIKILANGNNRWWVSTNHKHTQVGWYTFVWLLCIYCGHKIFGSTQTNSALLHRIPLINSLCYLGYNVFIRDTMYRTHTHWI